MLEQRTRHIHVTDDFWGRYIDIVKEKVIPYQWAALHDGIEGAAPSHAIENLKIAAGEAEGEFHGFVFQDSDVAKWIEAAAYTLAERPDPELEQRCDELIALISRAQQPDGYLNTHYTIKAPTKRWTNLRDNHELYVAGHLIEAAVAYYETTGKQALLDVVCKFADLIDQVFGPEPGKLRGYDGHQEIELALLKLYRVKGDRRYLRLAQFFIEERGKEPHFFDDEAKKRGEDGTFWYSGRYEYSQSHLPVRQQQEATGHAVRAVYMYTAMADLANETDDEQLAKVCRTLWDNVTNQQMYITGGIGSAEFGEAFTFAYDLPNDLAYTETCASIGLVFWAKNMLELEADSRYGDVMERALYNGTISGIQLDGTKFFYVNPLEVWPQAAKHRHDLKHVKTERQPWFGCACCPPNIARLLASIGQYIYTTKNQTGFIHLYIGNESTLTIGSGEVGLKMKSSFPWKGEVGLEVNPDTSRPFTLAFRIPSWANDYQLTVNGHFVDVEVRNGYAYVERTWQKGDHISIQFPLETKVIYAHPEVRANAGKIALQRGPIVFCAEEADNGNNLQSVAVRCQENIDASFADDRLNGVIVLEGKGVRTVTANANESLYLTKEALQTEEVTLQFIPYYAWANRGEGEMAVWLRHR
ncbi:glycoside hydrolase family 127 protein [Shouchella clausii]|uniref:glycoside hydrolase family 127 protein n=1 Tax=Shouchella clausii TaxID=79880 RepID=UPI000BA5D2A1|nr:beta-L-arabinofuranosidase domain-containing protein [Shouchella clausii]PAE91459.1 hypothetical protein CHH70_18145 [Shouchella clausii]